MAIFMNEYEIDDALDMLRAHAPELAPYAKYLADWRDTVNENSDGWPYWKAGRSCAVKLMEAVHGATLALRTSKPLPPEEDFAKALRPIKAAATRLKLPAPVLSAPDGPAPGM